MEAVAELTRKARTPGPLPQQLKARGQPPETTQLGQHTLVVEEAEMAAAVVMVAVGMQPLSGCIGMLQTVAGAVLAPARAWLQAVRSLAPTCMKRRSTE